MKARKQKGRIEPAESAAQFPIGKTHPPTELPAEKQAFRNAPTRWIKAPAHNIAFHKGKR